MLRQQRVTAVIIGGHKDMGLSGQQVEQLGQLIAAAAGRPGGSMAGLPIYQLSPGVTWQQVEKEVKEHGTAGID